MTDGLAGLPLDPGLIRRAEVRDAPALDPREDFDPSLLGAGERPMRAPVSDEALMRESLAELRRHGVRRAVTDGSAERVAQWRAAAPASVTIVPAVPFAGRDDRSVDALRALHRADQRAVFAEVAMQDRGIRVDDPRWEPYFALAVALGPEAGAAGVGESIRAIEEALFLDAAQKRDLFYGNAARFLRLTPAEIAADHAESPAPVAR